VYTPTIRKEINFFDQYYECGPSWYEAFFPSPEHSAEYQAIGEISPQYLECSECPKRISTTLPGSKLIVIMRHPVARAYSQYGLFVQRRNYRGSFEDFVAERPRALERGYYSRFLRRYLRYFDRAQILALIFEDAVRDVGNTKKQLADFLEIDVDEFLENAGSQKVHSSSVPRFQTLYGLVAKGRLLRKWRLEPVVDFVTRSRVMQILARGKSLPPLDGELKTHLSQAYRDEFSELEQCMQVDLSRWRE
jgi:hypothetical protein